MASRERQSLLQDQESSSEVSAAISSLLQENHSGTEVLGRTVSGNQLGFVPVELAALPTVDFNSGFEMSRALERCKKRVLNPYHYFLKTIGWRAFRSINHDLEQPVTRRIINVVYPIIIVVLLLISCVTQILTCFRRDWGQLNEKNCSNGTVFHLSCEEHIFTIFIFPDILLVSAYIYGIYVFRFKHPEYLSTLMETTFLGYCTKHGRFRPGKLIMSLYILMMVGVAWVVLSLGVNIMRVKRLHLLDEYTYINWIPPRGQSLVNIDVKEDEKSCEPSDSSVRTVLVILTLFGFIIFDLAYIATVMNYSCQCHLLTCLVLGLKERILMKAVAVDEAIKAVKPAQDFLKRLNGSLAAATSVVMFIFITSLVATIVGVLRREPQHTFEVVLVVLAILQWTTIFLMPIFYATKLTKACQKLKRLGHEVRARPYTYHNIKQVELDSFLTYMSSLELSAKLVMVPMYPSLVAGTLFLTVVVFVCVFSSLQSGGEFLASWL